MGVIVIFSYLPPVDVFLVDDLQNVSAAELQSGFLTGNQVIVGRVIIKMALHEDLKKK